MHVLVQIGLVSLGSALGGLLRWGVALGFGQIFGTAFPWGTFFINISGSLFLGWFSSIVTDRFSSFAWLRADDLRDLVLEPVGVIDSALFKNEVAAYDAIGIFKATPVTDGAYDDTVAKSVYDSAGKLIWPAG